MLAVTAQHITLPSGRILWTEVFGAGSSASPAILFANGMASTTNAWNSLISSLPESFLATHTIVLHDAANTGKSVYQPDLPAPTLASFATEARSVLEYLGFEAGYWVGHSFGGQQGFVAAAQDAQFWKGLLLLAPQTDRITPRTISSMHAMMDVFAADPETAAYANEIHGTPGPSMAARNGIYGAFAREMALRQRSEGLALAFRALLAPREGDFAWRHMRTRIVMVFGGKDEIAPISEGLYALGRLEGVEGVQGQLVVLEEAGHWMNWEYEEHTKEEVMRLVAGTS
ncbi:hypothetical protein EPUS_01352 [Endocarpon pusillum Z07020]|uniref:AB hydrolase-1 domain-containing protein n=1 Tax=Endocarpon pusillum (strain Z07020 / HMAS-L-300199) TaxID=1263415 RepID=U1GVA7_ENDPU|nr:uncharacterized protein EPUS_01352 [Endocarpon pusillum Z07020]ERF75986.1 hypothetical protein EPUS_01352 [Endocarpon pusillum Z07020]